MIADTLSPIVYRPTGDRLLIRKDESREQTARGLYLPGNIQGQLIEGTVLALGPGLVSIEGKYITPPFNEGDVVLFSTQACVQVDPDAPDQVMVASQSILAVKVAAHG